MLSVSHAVASLRPGLRGGPMRLAGGGAAGAESSRADALYAEPRVAFPVDATRRRFQCERSIAASVSAPSSARGGADARNRPQTRSGV